uniref:CSON012397 protein n=1 Tax=Culicoides sonorensis TaxID=179676 RepID=A0A336KJM9_CULSO
MDLDKFYFVDVIHGKVQYPGYVKTLIETEEFQRLRHLKQLGTSSQVFYSATHTRYEHSLGVCYLALKLMQTLERNCGITISEIHRKCVAIAGLFHDLGHGPFSHMWEDYVRVRNPSEQWTHEQTSCNFVKHFFEKHDMKLSKEPFEHLYGIELIQALISGDQDRLKTFLTPDLMYLAEIVSNKFTEIDVDKQDYILRDEYFLKGNIRIIEFQGLFDRCRITKDENNNSHISYHIDDYDLICNLFENRANLHIYCYQEPTIRGAEKMIMDALVLAEEAGFKIKGVAPSEMHRDLEKFLYLTDSIVNQVYASDDPKLKEAQAILRRLNTGDLYKLVWMSPTIFNIDALTQKFGPHFFQISKKIPLSSVFMAQKIIFHNDDGNAVPPPIEKLPKQPHHYIEYLIFSKNSSIEHLNAVSEFILDMKE